LETSARKASQQLGISYPTAHKAFHLIRQSIIAHSGSGDSLLDGEVEAKETYLKTDVRATARKFQNRISCLRYSRKESLVKVEPLQNVGAEAVSNLMVRAVRKGSIVYADRWGRYETR